MPSQYGIKTASILDVPIEKKSYVARHLNANGVDFTSAQTVRLLNYDISGGSLGTYDETAISQTVTLAETDKQDMTLAYNKYKFLRIQDTLEQDTPIASLASKFAKTWVYEKFIPDFDAYALTKIIAARPVANKVFWNSSTDSIKLKFFNTVTKVKRGGGTPDNSIAWVPYAFSDTLKALITTFDGSDLGYTAGKNGVLGQLDGVVVVETEDTLFPANMDIVVADKRAVVRVTPKMDPATGSGMKLIKDVPGHGGSELQLRARGDVFVFGLKAKAIATLERSNS
ncbi:MAG TPA: hypothetical protein VD907_06990 [Verrucomicrobiae bacterium]|nr:hypothetical protein [Verrucomicrobiae bacterium]